MRRIILKILKELIPRNLKMSLRNYKILAIDIGQYQSIKKKIPIDKEGNPIPWYTYSMIEYLKRFDFSNKSVFEWGCGNSSFFWAKRAEEVISIEDDKKWFDIMNKSKLSNQKIIFFEKKNDYIKAILNQNH